MSIFPEILWEQKRERREERSQKGRQGEEGESRGMEEEEQRPGTYSQGVQGVMVTEGAFESEFRLATAQQGLLNGVGHGPD